MVSKWAQAAFVTPSMTNSSSEPQLTDPSSDEEDCAGYSDSSSDEEDARIFRSIAIPAPTRYPAGHWLSLQQHEDGQLVRGIWNSFLFCGMHQTTFTIGEDEYAYDLKAETQTSPLKGHMKRKIRRHGPLDPELWRV